MVHLDDDGEIFDLTTFFDRILGLPTLAPHVITGVLEKRSPVGTSQNSSRNPDDDFPRLEVPMENNTIKENYNQYLPARTSGDTSRNPEVILPEEEVPIEFNVINENYNEFSTTQNNVDYSTILEDILPWVETYDENSLLEIIEDASTDPNDIFPRSEVPVDINVINENFNECSTTQKDGGSSTNPDYNLPWIETYEESSTTQNNEDSSKPNDEKEGINQDQHQIASEYSVKDSMGTSSSRDPLNTESDGTGDNSFICFVQKPLGGNDNEGKFETFHDEDAESRVVHDPSLGQESEAHIQDSFIGRDLFTENTGYQYESIDTSYQSSFSEAINEVKSDIFHDYPLGLKREASTGDVFLGSDLITNNLGCYSESIDSSHKSSFSEAVKEEKHRITTDPSLGMKTETFVEETLLGNDRNTENPEVPEDIPEEKFRTHHDLSFELKSKVSVRETFLGKNRTEEYPQKVENDVGEDKPRIEYKPLLGLKTDDSVDEKLLDGDRNTAIRRDIQDGSSFKVETNNHSSLAEEEFTNYYPTPYTTTMKVIRNDRKSGEDQILRCKIDGFTCNFCGDKFRSRNELREHKRGYVSFVPSGAFICSRYSQRYSIVVSSGNQSSIQMQFKCSHCQRRFKRFGDYARHCNNEQICQRNRSYLVSPFVQQCRLGNGDMGFECLLCQESSTVYAELKFHECLISRDLPEKCYEDLPADEDSDDDDSEEESEEESMKCSLCGVEFRDTQDFADHQLEHVRGERYECKVCYKSFNRLCSFKTHMADSHKGKTRQKKDRSAKRKP